MVVGWLVTLIVLLPIAMFLFNGKQRGNVWLGVKYVVGFLIALALFFILFEFIGIWTVLVFPIMLFVILFMRKQTRRKSANGPLDDFRAKH